MTRQEMEQFAMDNYPIGTKFKPAHDPTTSRVFTVTGYDFSRNESDDNDIFCTREKEAVIWPLLYTRNDGWAPIADSEGNVLRIPDPKKTITNNYELY